MYLLKKKLTLNPKPNPEKHFLKKEKPSTLNLIQKSTFLKFKKTLNPKPNPEKHLKKEN